MENRERGMKAKQNQARFYLYGTSQSLDALMRNALPLPEVGRACWLSELISEHITREGLAGMSLGKIQTQEILQSSGFSVALES